MKKIFFLMFCTILIACEASTQKKDNSAMKGKEDIILPVKETYQRVSSHPVLNFPEVVPYYQVRGGFGAPYDLKSAKVQLYGGEKQYLQFKYRENPHYPWVFHSFNGAIKYTKFHPSLMPNRVAVAGREQKLLMIKPFADTPQNYFDFFASTKLQRKHCKPKRLTEHTWTVERISSYEASEASLLNTDKNICESYPMAKYIMFYKDVVLTIPIHVADELLDLNSFVYTNEK